MFTEVFELIISNFPRFNRECRIKSDEISPGVKKPTIILAEMIALTLIEELPEISFRHPPSSEVPRITTSKFWLECTYLSHKFITINKHSFPGVVFHGRALEIIHAALLKVQLHRRALLDAKHQEDVQNKALDAIAAWTGISNEGREMYVVQFLTDGAIFQEDWDFELSVVKEGSHGHGESWGWPDDDKIILLTGDGHYSPETIEYVKQMAQQLANILNERKST